jgi:predicted outer membrane repeat protein
MWGSGGTGRAFTEGSDDDEKMRRLSAVLSIVGVAFLAGSRPSEAVTRHVPGVIGTIQAAIDSSSSGDTITVAPGVYNETLVANAKQLFLLGSGYETTILDAEMTGRCILFDGGGEIRGFTIKNGRATDFGAGISITGPAVRVADTHIYDCIVGSFDKGVGGGIYLYSLSNSLIENCRFERNRAGDSGGGICDRAALTVIRNNVFIHISCHVAGGGLETLVGYVYNNLFLGNTSDSFGGGIYGGGIEIYNNTLIDNGHNNPFNQGAGMHIGQDSPTVRNNLVVGSHGPEGANSGVGIKCSSGGSGVTLSCNNSWANDGADFVVSGSCDAVNNISLDPLFCNRSGGDFGLSKNSPCANYPACGLIGAYPITCSIGVLVLKSTWSQIKALGLGRHP